jgi:superfamily I DNA/RNA helicase
MTPTPEQAAIVEAAKRTSDNLLINALAGAAKTTTLQLVCQAVTGIPILSLAFNRRIADEMKKRLPSHAEARTLNSLGHEVWGRAIGKRLVVDTSMTFHNPAREKLDSNLWILSATSDERSVTVTYLVGGVTLEARLSPAWMNGSTHWTIRQKITSLNSSRPH